MCPCRVRRSRGTATTANPNSCEAVFARLIAEGVGREELYTAVSEQQVEIVLTAHPTQVREERGVREAWAGGWWFGVGGMRKGEWGWGWGWGVCSCDGPVGTGPEWLRRACAWHEGGARCWSRRWRRKGREGRNRKAAEGGRGEGSARGLVGVSGCMGWEGAENVVGRTPAR